MTPNDAPESAERPDRRESIWSVSERWRWLYFTSFLLLLTGGSSLVAWDTLFGEGAGKSVVQSVLAAFMAEASIAVASAGMSLGITEVVMLSTLLSRKLDERKARILREGRQAGLAEGRQTGLAEGRQTGLAEGRQAGLAEGRQTGLAEGRQAGRLAERAEWDAWLERMLAAQSAGEAFTEPPPSRRADDVNGSAHSNGA